MHHVSMAQGSLAEVETQLELAARLNYVGASELGPIQEQCDHLGRQLPLLRTALAKRLRPSPESLIPNP
jgi:four helix bundle protein